MACVFIDTANLAGSDARQQDTLDNYFEILEKSNITPTKYKVFNTVANGTDLTLLKGYKYDQRGENLQTGCSIDGKTTVRKLEECLRGITDLEREKNFYIISANSAHHFSFILSKYAFYAATANDSSSANRKKVVINFDNHLDYGRRKNTIRLEENISCGTWGSFHTLQWRDSAEYAVLCAHSEPSDSKQYRVYKNNAVSVEGKSNVIKHLKSYRAAKHNVYVTVDRDFMLNNGTKYGDRNCAYNNEEGKAFIGECMSILRKNSINIVGGDIIGLPTRDDEHSKSRLKEAAADIKFVKECLNL